MSPARTAAPAAESMCASMALRHRCHGTEDCHRDRKSNRDEDCLHCLQKFFFHIFLPNLAFPKRMRVAFAKGLKAWARTMGADVEKHQYGSFEPPVGLAAVSLIFVHPASFLAIVFIEL
jgi:hypothetical protein